MHLFIYLIADQIQIKTDKKFILVEYSHLMNFVKMLSRFVSIKFAHFDSMLMIQTCGKGDTGQN